MFKVRLWVEFWIGRRGTVRNGSGRCPSGCVRVEERSSNIPKPGPADSFNGLVRGRITGFHRREKSTVSIPWAPGMLCDSQHKTDQPVGQLQALDATWMDDASFLIRADSASELPTALAATGSAVLDACLSRALLPNPDRGKTEVVAEPIVTRGTGAASCPP